MLGITLSTLHDFLGYSSEQPSEVDTILIHIVQISKLKCGGTVNSHEVTSPMYSRSVSASHPTQWPHSYVLASQVCSEPGGQCVFLIMIINTWVTSSEPENMMHHYCLRSLSKNV